METEFGAVVRDLLVLGYMLFLRIGVPLLIVVMGGTWIQRRMAESDMREQRARRGEPYCWDRHNNAASASAKRAAAAHPELPCWLAVQTGGGGVTESCFSCPRYAVKTGRLTGETAEVS
jgi:hypothetical protein